MATEGLAVRFRDCTCPDTPHDGRDGADDGDIVYLRSTLGFVAGAEALRKITEAAEDMSMMAETVGPTYVREGPITWNVVGEDGPLPYDPDTILSDYSWAYPIVAAADDLYSAVVLRPLVERMATLSNGGPTGPSTPAIRASTRSRRSPRKSSSANGSAGPQSVPSR